VGTEHLAELVRLLYPEPHVLDIPGAPAPPGRRPPVVAEYLVIPHARRPRLGLPVRPRATRLGALRHAPAPRRGRDRLRLAAVRAALGASCAPFRSRVRVFGTAGEDSLQAYLGQVLGQPVALCLYIGGPRRANHKPVVEILDAGGQPIGFAKLGVNALTRDLVRAEAGALAVLGAAGLRRATVPPLRHAGRWRDHELLVQGVLPVWQRPARPAGAVPGAMVEVAGASGTAVTTLGGSGYRDLLERRLDAVAGRPGVRDPHVGPALRAAARHVLARGGGVTLAFGNWHGDWTPWNMHPLRDTVLVWDWERFTQGVPLGFDALHCALARAVDAGTGPGEAAAVLVRDAAGHLAPYGVPPAIAELTALLYLLDVGARYLADRLDEAGQRLSAIGDWLLPAVRPAQVPARW
jgi:hypothetical protein